MFKRRDVTCLFGGKTCICIDVLSICIFQLWFSVQPNPFGATETYHSVPPTSQQEKQFATCSIFLLIQLYSMNLVLYKHHSFIHCFVLSLKDQTYTTDSRKPFLEIDVKGGERDHIKACRRERSHQGREKVSRTKPTREKVLRGRERLPGGENTQGSQMSQMLDAWCSRGEMSHVFLGGKTCSFVSFSSDLLFLIFSQYPM